MTCNVSIVKIQTENETAAAILFFKDQTKPKFLLHSPYYAKACNEFAVPIFVTCIVDVEVLANRFATMCKICPSCDFNYGPPAHKARA